MAAYTPLKQSDVDPPAHGFEMAAVRKAKRLHYTGLATLLAGLTLVALALLHTPAPWQSAPFSAPWPADTPASPPQCVPPIPPPASPPALTNPWASLSVPDAAALRTWISSPEHGLNLTPIAGAALSDNYIFTLEALRPSKAVALAYLAAPADVSPPERYARVVVHHGAAREPVVKEYVVGPLPVGEETKMEERRGVYHREEIPYNARGIALGAAELAPLVARIMPQLAEATQELFGAVARGLPNDTLVAGMSAPWGFDGSFRRIWITWRRNVPGPYLHPISFFHYVDTSGTDPSQWKLLKLVYNNQIFPSADAFLQAFHNGTLRRLPDRPDQRADLAWSARARVGPPLDLDHLPGPRSVSFAGLRFRVDQELQYVSWMGWGLYLGFNRDMGLSLWDVRLRGERIIYELSPQEAIAQYAGHDPFQGTTAWLDSYFGMGALTRDLLPGYDCPHEAVYLPATTHTGGGSTVRARAVCVFEQDAGRPLTRHMGYMDGEFGAVKGYVLTVRSISTVGNYDYLFDYMFQMDGTIEVRLSASGYLQGGFWEDQQAGYGAKIRDTTMGNLHDHVINYKVDLDIAGVRNSLLHTSTAQEEITRPWLDPDEPWGRTVVQQKITRTYIANEDAARVRYPPNFQGGYALVNRDVKNRWGSPRGYAIHAGLSPVHNTVAGSRRMLKNAQYNLAVSRRKESEPVSSSMWNLHLPGAPMVEFDRFFDGENITQEDLVAWVNVGTHHLPQAEDTPNTRTNTAASSFFLTPLNYFDYDISIDASNAILLREDGVGWAHDDYGVKPTHCVPAAVPPFEYEGAEVYGEDGEQRVVDAGEMRREAEGVWRMRVEL